MKYPTIVFYELWPDLVARAEKLLGKIPYSLHSEPLTPENLDSGTEILVVSIDSYVTPEVLDRLPKLKYITTMSTGYDHIDLAAARERGIAVSNVPAYGENTVAEHTFALILGLTRRLFESIQRVKDGRFDSAGLRGIDLAGKTLGIIGTGRIGVHVARMATGFEMKVVAYDVKTNARLARQLGFSYVSVNTLLKKSDIVSLHLPLFPATYHMLNKKNILLMKQGSILVNTSRGGLVDPEALLKGLQDGHIAAAGLDVLEDENLLQYAQEGKRPHNNAEVKSLHANRQLINHPNVIVTPHNAFNSTEALERIVATTVENVRGFIKKKPQNIVNLK